MPAEEPSVHSSKDAEPGHKDQQRKQACTASRVSEEGEEQPGPSRVQSRQGYCSFCQVLYSNVEQHIQSPSHREVVRSSRSSVKSGSLMERFLQDVIQHHPHHYNDPRPTHSDLPSLSRPLVPREELSEVCQSDDDAVSMGTREDMPSSENASSCQLVYVQEAEVTTTTGTNSQQGEGKEGKMDPDRLAGFVPGEDIGRTPVQRTHTPLSEHSHTPPPIHRKAHRKTNRRRERGSSSSSSVRPPVVTPTPQPSHQPSSKPMDPSPDPKPRVESFTWVEWVAKPPWKRDEAFSSDHSDPIGDLIEEVIEKYCYGRSPVRRQQGDTESFHFSLPESQGAADSEEWDAPVQVALGQDAHTQGGGRTPGPARQPEGRDLTCLTEVQVNLEDEVYTSQLDSALNTLTHGGGRGEGGTGEEVEREPRIEDILPAPPHIPQSFVGKTWTQVLLEDEVKVETMVQEFRQGHFFCYFDSESLARYGRKGHSKRRQNKQFKEANVFPLLDHDEDDPQCTRRRRRRASRRCSFRLASRCQVVKVSQSTQTVPFVVPFVRQQTLTQSGATTDSQKSCQDPRAALEQEKTPEMRTRLCSLRLPPSYSRVMTPLQPKTSLLYVLCSPETTPTDPKPRLRAGGRGRKRKGSTCEGDGGLKVKYKRVPLRYYDPVTNRIVKLAPKGFLPPPCSAAPRPPHIRQLFRSLSPDINSERLGTEGREPGGRPAAGEGRDGSGSGRRRGRSAGSAVSGSAGVKGQGSSEAGSSLTSPFSRSSLSNSSRFLLGALTPDTTSDSDVVSRQSRKGGKRKSASLPTPEKGPSPPYIPHRPGLRRGGGKEKAVPRSSKRGRPPRALTPKELSPSPQPKKGASQRGVERRTVPCSRGPSRSVPPTALRHRPLGCRSSPRLTPVPLSPRTLRTRVRR